jgi:hypothetical protein
MTADRACNLYVIIEVPGFDKIYNSLYVTGHGIVTRIRVFNWFSTLDGLSFLLTYDTAEDRDAEPGSP